MLLTFQIVFGAICAILLTMAGFKVMQILQLSSYRVGGLMKWFKSTKFDYILRYFALGFFAFVSMLVFVACFGKYEYCRLIGSLFLVAGLILFVTLTQKQKSKTPLKFTPRIIRLTVLSFLLFFGATFGLTYAGEFTVLQYSLAGFMPLLVIPVVLLAYYILWPFEMLNNMRYVSRARKKLAERSELVKIGITGSYGKTTAKNILAAMLNSDYSVLYSESSFNTPLGIAKTVNYELKPEHNVFIAEMGARRKGDIKELCELVRPSIGIITAVGPQHLETFRTVENIADTKYELVEGLTEGGTAVLSSDNEYTRKMYEKAACKKYLAGENGNEVSYGGVSFGAYGTSFTLKIGGEERKVTCKLLGRHIPSLVSLCAQVATALNVSIDNIVSAVENLEPVEHRLQLIESGEVTVIDDAYNSNSEGAKIALEVLSAFEGARIIVTPGLVEMGDAEESANNEVGRLVAKHADYAFFVGARAEWLRAGAIDGGMNEDRITTCSTLDEAVSKLGEIHGKKTVLFENDLPDNL